MSDWYKDSIILLEEAGEILKQIKQIEVDSVKDTGMLRRAQPKIKHFLDDCRAPLDYLAVFLRDTYTNNKQRVYFPFSYNQNNFERRIKSDFKNKLPKDVLIIISSYQPFYNQSQSLGWLNRLTNENKHQKLSNKTQTLEQTINHLTLPGNNRFSNITVSGCATPIAIGDVKYDLINNFPNDSADVSNRNILIFEEYNLEVVHLLNEILVNTTSLVEKINSITIN